MKCRRCGGTNLDHWKTTVLIRVTAYSECLDCGQLHAGSVCKECEGQGCTGCQGEGVFPHDELPYQSPQTLLPRE